MRPFARIALVVALVATVLVVVGAFGPWATINATTISHAGVDGRVGWTTAILAVCAFALLVVAVVRGLGWLALTAAVPAGTAGGLALRYALDPSAFLNNPGTEIAHRGWGLTLVIVGAIALAVCCVLVALESRRGRAASAKRGRAK